jgi:predicted amidohydrolase
MKVAFVQMRPEFGNKGPNIEKALALMGSREAELYVLPELFASGYVFISDQEVAKLSETAGQGVTFKALSGFAERKNCGVVYGFPERATDGYYNSSAFVDNHGNFKLYRKLHLFFEEKKYFLPGNFPLEVFPFREASLGIMICYDWIYPEVTRILALRGADIICHPANLVMNYCQDAMKTRSIENRVFTITANRTGEERRGGQGFVFTGGSQITDCKGNILYRADANKEEVFTADIKIEDARDKNINALNNLWQDRRVEYYKRLGEK